MSPVEYVQKTDIIPTAKEKMQTVNILFEYVVQKIPFLGINMLFAKGFLSEINLILQRILHDTTKQWSKITYSGFEKLTNLKHPCQ